MHSKVGWSAVVLILGFSLFGAVLDYSLMAAKLRVVKYRDRLTERHGRGRYPGLPATSRTARFWSV